MFMYILRSLELNAVCECLLLSTEALILIQDVSLMYTPINNNYYLYINSAAL